MAVKDKISGAWRDVTAMYDKIGGVWRPTLNEWVKVNGVWRKTYNGAKNVYFKPYLQTVENLTGSYELTAGDNAMRAVVSGYTGGENKGCAVGWIVQNVPAGATVEVAFNYSKGGYPMNDIVVYSETATLGTYSSEGGPYPVVINTTRHTGWILFIVNFFPTNVYATTSSLTITKLTVNGQQVWPAVN